MLYLRCDATFLTPLMFTVMMKIKYCYIPVALEISSVSLGLSSLLALSGTGMLEVPIF